MPPHIIWRKGKGRSIAYLVDGRKIRRSLATDKKGIAEFKLAEYIKEKYGIKAAEPKQRPTVKEYYERWIKTKTQPLCRASLVRDYKQGFTRYILPEFSSITLSSLSTNSLKQFQSILCLSGLSVKTVKNLINSTFRAMWRDAKRDGLVSGDNPFRDLKWPRKIKHRPDPFTPAECVRILAYFKEHEPFYHAFVLFVFSTGMRPSEVIALQWCDVDMENCEIHINKSRHLKADAPPKTSDSGRIITVSPELVDLLRGLPTRRHEKPFVWMNKYGNQLDANNFARDYWGRALLALGIRHRKFYQYKHTFITEALKRRELAEAVADYCGTSEQMIKDNYRGAISLSSATIMPQLLNPPLENQVVREASPTGFEPVEADALRCVKVLSMIEYEKLRRKKSA